MPSRDSFDLENEAGKLIDSIPCGIVVTDRDSTVLFANDTMRRWTGQSGLGSDNARRFSDLLTRPGRIYFETHIAPMLVLQGYVREISCHIELPDGNRMPVVLNAAARPDAKGQIERIIYTLFDARERSVYEGQLRQARREAEELAAIVRTSANAIFRIDPKTIVRRWNRAAERLTGVPAESAVGRPISESLSFDSHADWIVAARNALKDKDEYTFECQLPGGTDVLVAVTEIGDQLSGPSGSDLSIVISNVTARKQAERRLELIVGEMKHRIKNSIGVITAVARQTIPEAHVEDFAARMRAMAKAQDLLASETWSEVSLADVLAIAAEEAGGPPAFEFEGPEIVLKASLATSFSMVFHELVTNAIKYGALSVEQGRVTVTYRVDEDSGSLILDWVESGGPEVNEPSSLGFGTRMLQLVFGEGSGASFATDFAPSGLRCQLCYPMGKGARTAE